MAVLEQLRLMLVTDSQVAGEGMLDAVEGALRGGVRGVMLREKNMPARQLFDLAVRLRRLTEKAEALLIVNDRVDVALAAGADGVHLGWLSLPVAQARKMVGRGLVGVSTHSPAEVKKAEAEGADYVTYGPIFPTPSKEGLVETQGVAGVRQACAMARIPVLGLGGIGVDNAREVMEAGAFGVAFIRAILAAPDAEEAARALVREVSVGKDGEKG